MPGDDQSGVCVCLTAPDGRNLLGESFCNDPPRQFSMKIIDKRKTFENLSVGRPVQLLELGCGARKRCPSAIGVDLLDSECVDIVGDVYDVLAQFPDNTVAAITSSHFLEHIPDVQRLVDEMARVLTDRGRLEVVVPHFSSPYFYSDVTHKQCFGLYTFSYFAEDSLLRRKVPRYGRTPKFQLVDVELRFKAPRPFYGRYVFKRLVGLVVNSCYYLKEFYEENLSCVLPCYEIRYILRRLP